MVEHLENQIRKALWRCANRDMSLDDFRVWFVPLSWNIEESGEPAAIELAHRIDGILAEASSAGWSDDELRDELAGPFVASRFGHNLFCDSRLPPVAESNAKQIAVNAFAAA